MEEEEEEAEEEGIATKYVHRNFMMPFIHIFFFQASPPRLVTASSHKCSSNLPTPREICDVVQP
jgi:hypothetical protein